jgi:deoxyadenosine/deoxycytidine kinase
MDEIQNVTRIEVCGGIASGKTTFANLMSSIGFLPLFENFRANPFWEAFYSNPGKYIFETEVSFTLQHYHQIKKEAVSDKINICDFSFLLDIAYAEVGLRETQLRTYLTVYEEIKRELPSPILLVHLFCDADTEMKRIRARARKVESSITLEFLDSLNKAVDRQVHLSKGKQNIITIDSAEKNFADDDAVKEEMIALINTEMARFKAND